MEKKFKERNPNYEISSEKATEFLKKEHDNLLTNYPELTVAISSLKKATEVLHQEIQREKARKKLMKYLEKHQIDKVDCFSIGLLIRTQNIKEENE